MHQESDRIQNWTWKAMSEPDKAALRPHTYERLLAQGDILMRTDDHVDVVYFPISADLASIVRLEDGSAGMVTTVGREGLTGLAAFLANERLGWDIQVQIGGHAWGLPADVLRHQAKVSPDLAEQLLQLTHTSQVQAARTAICNLRHSVKHRLARWLLSTQDRTGQSQFRTTQEEVALLLGVQRTTLNAAFQTLESIGGVRIGRGNIRVVDRNALRVAACECYCARHVSA
ncbi:hypothetical protein ASG17_07460 [Brevundimonas sp. Leaf363]|uniref:Crp/Fnr family transcriptional regulator n=1 Tax=Brevundimonas sp. Leaf363 TaxID=1736353 RepID=UPI0006FB8100|nr:Crp/Fnr family transcriptional regulator [Brevundimonas sp. Leaf363]KQS55880.1 hypothetical protein ASG17_07460 [Brevundimonas sp. Leaf363]